MNNLIKLFTQPYLVGDINIGLLKSESCTTDEFVSLIYSHLLLPLIYRPTRIADDIGMTEEDRSKLQENVNEVRKLMEKQVQAARLKINVRKIKTIVTGKENIEEKNGVGRHKNRKRHRVYLSRKLINIILMTAARR